MTLAFNHYSRVCTDCATNSCRSRHESVIASNAAMNPLRRIGVMAALAAIHAPYECVRKGVLVKVLSQSCYIRLYYYTNCYRYVHKVYIDIQIIQNINNAIQISIKR